MTFFSFSPAKDQRPKAKDQRLKTFFLLAFLLLTGLLSAQNAFQDARALRAFVEEGRDGKLYFQAKAATKYEAFPILLKYTTRTDTAKVDQIIKALGENPFIGGGRGNAIIRIPNNFQGVISTTGSSKERFLGAGGGSGLSVTNLADGLAKFLVMRTKEELNIAFFSEFQQAVRDNDALNSLFPVTAGILATVGEDVYKFDQYLNVLRESFIKDLEILPRHLAVYLGEGNLIKQSHTRLLVRDALEISQLLLEHQTPDSLIRYCAYTAYVQMPEELLLVNDPVQQKRLHDLAAGLRVAALFSESLRSNKSGEIWVSGAEIKQALRDPITFNLYLGLLWQQSVGLGFSNDKTLHDALRPVANSIQQANAMRSFLTDFSEFGRDVRLGLDSVSAKRDAGAPVAYQEYHQVFNGVLGILESGVRIKQDFLGVDTSQTGLDRQFLSSLRYLNELNFDVRQKHYGSAINDLVRLLDLYLGKNYEFRPKLLKYGHFIATVAESQTSDEIAAAIEAVALPPGSAILKKQKPFSISLNAYTGLSGGGEQLQETGTQGYFAISAPLGLGINWGFGADKGSLSLFVPIIDVGALAVYRFNDPTTSDLPELEWGNLLSPGGYLAYGMPGKWPITLGLGAQLGPNLRRIDVGGNAQIDRVQAWRWGAFLSVDIPVFHLF